MAQRGRPTVRITLSDAERETLQRWSRRHSTAQALALRSRIVLASSEGRTDREVASGVPPVLLTLGLCRFRGLLI